MPLKNFITGSQSTETVKEPLIEATKNTEPRSTDGTSSATERLNGEPATGTSSGSLQRSVWILALLFLLLTLALNWPYQHVFTILTTQGTLDSVIDFKSVEPQAPVVAGWPYRYLIRHSSDLDRIERFSWVALAYNLGLALLVSATLLWYAHRRSQRSALSASNLTIADLLLLTALLAAPLWMVAASWCSANSRIGVRQHGSASGWCLPNVRFGPRFLGKETPRRTPGTSAPNPSRSTRVCKRRNHPKDRRVTGTQSTSPRRGRVCLRSAPRHRCRIQLGRFASRRTATRFGLASGH